jgi:hypothetical protein
MNTLGSNALVEMLRNPLIHALTSESGAPRWVMVNEIGLQCFVSEPASPPEAQKSSIQ